MLMSSTKRQLVSKLFRFFHVASLIGPKHLSCKQTKKLIVVILATALLQHKKVHTKDVRYVNVSLKRHPKFSMCVQFFFCSREIENENLNIGLFSIVGTTFYEQLQDTTIFSATLRS